MYNDENNDYNAQSVTDSSSEEVQSNESAQEYTESQPSQPPLCDISTSECNHNEKRNSKKEKRYGIGEIALTAVLTAILCIGLGILLVTQTSLFDSKDDSKTGSALPAMNDDGENPSNDLKYGALGTSGSDDASASDDTNLSIVEKCSRSIVSINVEVVTSSYFGDSVNTGSGSGIIITDDGYIATCYHVIAGASTINVSFQDGTTYEATVVGYDSRTDIAILKIEANNLPAVTLGDSSQYTVGDAIYAIGNPLGEFASTVTDGIISGIDRIIEVDGISMTLMQTNAAINPGNSGGGLFSAETGELIGIVNAKSYGLEIEGLGFAIPTSTALDIMKDLMDLGYVTGRPYIGITMQEYSTSTNPFYQMAGAASTIVKISSVSENSPAEEAGLKAEDVIVSFGGTEISSIDDLSAVLNGYNSGDKVEMIVERNNQKVTVSITLGEASGK